MDYFSAAQNLKSENREFVTVTLVARKGSVPQDPGAKMLVTKEGLYSGTVGGGKVELNAIQHGQGLIKRNEKKPELIKWNLQRDFGMSCGGEVEFLFEYHSNAEIEIAIFGAGHIAQALVRILSLFPFRVHVFDSRSEWVERIPESPNIRKKLVSDPAEEIQKLHPEAYFLVMTQGHATDFPILKEIFQVHPRTFFVGVIGSELKGKKIRAELREIGISAECVERLHCPMGLKLGTNQPAEIAISVLAQVLQERDRQKLAAAGRSATTAARILGLEAGK